MSTYALLSTVVKYKKVEESGLTNKIQKLSWHSVVKKGTRINQKLTQLTGLVAQVNLPTDTYCVLFISSLVEQNNFLHCTAIILI